MTRLDQIGINELAPILRTLADADVTTEDFGWLRSPMNAEKLYAFLQEARGLKVGSATDVAYAARFAAAIAVGGFRWLNQEQLTAANFPGETFGYNLKWRALPSNFDGYDCNEILAIVSKWVQTDATVQGGATAGDGLHYAAEVSAGRRDQPNGSLVCPGSMSVDGGLLCLIRDGSNRAAGVYTRGSRWQDVFVLLREVLPTQP